MKQTVLLNNRTGKVHRPAPFNRLYPFCNTGAAAPSCEELHVRDLANWQHRLCRKCWPKEPDVSDTA